MTLAPRLRRSLGAVVIALISALPASAADPTPDAHVQARQSAPATLDGARSSLVAEGRDRGRPRPLVLTLGITRPVPWRTALIDGPPRLVIDLQGVETDDMDPIPGADLVTGLRSGPAGAAGWGRVIVELPHLVRIDTARLRTGAAPAIEIRLEPVAPADFSPRSDQLAVLHGLPQPAAVARPGAREPAADARGPAAARPLRVVIDPGHGGIDPGAQVGAITEAAVMLGFARDLAAALQKAGIEPVLTRDDDSFIPLEARTTVARSRDADLFISLHADALPAGEAAGATIYTWDPNSNDRAARQLALHHDRDDLLAGIDLADTDENVTRALIDLARIDTQPRSQDFGRHLVAHLNRAGIPMHRVPLRGAAFSVLKSPDIPSVLLELGFLTHPGDRANLFNPEWRAGVAQAIGAAILSWAEDDAARSAQRRR